jgi:hypothetical protein
VPLGEIAARVVVAGAFAGPRTTLYSTVANVTAWDTIVLLAVRYIILTRWFVITY